MRFIITRILSGLAVIFVVSFMTFIILMMIPGDPALLSLGTEATPENVEALREAMGFNAPWYVQFLDWFTSFISGDLGRSYLYGEEISTLIAQRVPVTVSLALLSIIIATPLAIIIGVIAALRQNRLPDILARTLMQIGDAMPSFWLALLLLVYVAAGSDIFPISGYTPLSEGFRESLLSIILPAFVLSIGLMGTMIRIVRSSMLISLKQDYMLLAKMNGIGKLKTIIKYPLRSAIIAPLTIIGMQMAGLLSGVILVENIFSLPGLGRLLLVAVQQRDLFLLQGIVVVIVSTVVIINMITDILYRLANPTMKLGGSDE